MIDRDNGRASVMREVARLSKMARQAHVPRERYRLLARALSLNAAYLAWVSGHTWADELEGLIAQTVRMCGDDDVSEVAMVWADETRAQAG